MTTEERKEQRKKYRESHKEELKEQRKKYYENHKEKQKEKVKRWRENNKDKIKEYYENNKEKISEKRKIRYAKNRDKELERMKKYNENNKEHLYIKSKEWREKNHDFKILSNHVSKYFNDHKVYRYIGIENYLTIMKLEDRSLKQSIMTRLGLGTIDQDEAVTLSGMVWTEEDQIELDNYWKRRKRGKRPSYSY